MAEINGAKKLSVQTLFLDSYNLSLSFNLIVYLDKYNHIKIQ